MPTFTHGKATRLWVDKYDFSRYYRDFAGNSQIGTSETSGFGSSAKEFIAGIEEGTLTLQGLLELTALTGTDAFFASVRGSGTKQNVIVALQGHAVGGSVLCLNSDTTSYNISAPIGDVVKADASFSSSASGIEGGVLLTPSTTISATTNGASVDNAILTSNGGCGWLSVPADTRNGTIIVKVQHSADNIAWADLVTFTTISSSTPTSERVEVASGTIVNRYLRAQYTVAGTTGSATLVVAFTRR